MKILIAVVRPEKLPDVKQALLKDDVHMMTIVDVRGCGQQKGFVEEYRGIVEEVQLHRKVMLFIAINDSYVDKALKAIVKGARTNGGGVGDGKIFVLPLDDCVRIRTGETGVHAIGGEAPELKKSDGKSKVIVI
ncbi:MAG: P-II family nitrogen regulator [Candidatus Woesearchaeota archaeon]|jgi:nitrogen regulatory protein P-II 1|nr:P-II family nitrogen regulator [Candidatus Woesearchaeota archaeon]